MNELIHITERKGQQVIDARELHSFLENGKRFTDWMKMRIVQYGLVEGVDYTSFHQVVKRATGGTTRKEYALTISCAKELAMVEGNAKGKEARQYFIACEETLRKVQNDPLLLLTQTLQQQTKLLIEQGQRLSTLEQHVALPDLLPGAAETSRQESLRGALLMSVDLYASARNIDDQQVWHHIYNRLYELYKIRIWDYQKSYESLLTVAERLDLLDKLYSIAQADFKLRLSPSRH